MYETAAQMHQLNPWLSIWSDPRATIRHLISTDPTRNVILLAALWGISQILFQAVSSSLGEHLSLSAILLAAAVIGPVFGVLGLYVTSFLVHWTGGWIGGRGSSEHIRTAIAWSYVPVVLGMVLLLLLTLVVGPVLFLDDAAMESYPIGAAGGLLMAVFGLAVIVLYVWSVVILLKGLGEVQGFSAWKALGNLILAALPIFAVMFVLLFLALGLVM